jgi:hypothetical protein
MVELYFHSSRRSASLHKHMDFTFVIIVTIIIIIIIISSSSSSSSYKHQGRGFDSRWGEFLNLPNPSGRTRPWGLLSL